MKILTRAAIKALVLTTAVTALATYAHEADPTACYVASSTDVFSGPCFEGRL